jgi:cyclic pyranopterin phosphate synthase
MSKLTHMDDEGNARMVDVGAKSPTQREAVAEGWIQLTPSAFDCLQAGDAPKGDVLQIAQIAGIQAAKKTSDLIPLCHPLPISGIKLVLETEAPNRVYVWARVRCDGKTGVEMEALTAVSGALLCVYDMLKAIDKNLIIGPIQLVEKSGGKSGDWKRQEP